MAMNDRELEDAIRAKAAQLGLPLLSVTVRTEPNGDRVTNTSFAPGADAADRAALDAWRSAQH